MEDSTFFSLLKDANAEQLTAPVLVVSVVLFLLVVFVFRYVRPSLRLAKSLAELKVALKKAKAFAPAQRRSELQRIFAGSSLEHSWDEYSETLHDQ